MGVEAIIFDLGKTIISVPREHDEDFLLSCATGIPESTIVLWTYEICTQYPKLTVAEFGDRLRMRFLDRGVSCTKSTIDLAFEESIAFMEVQPDAPSALAELARRGKRIAVISNTNPLSHIRLGRSGLLDLFSEVVFSCDIGLWKPDPRVFALTFKRLGVDYAKGCIVGDRIRTLALGVVGLGTKIVLVERRTKRTLLSDQLPVDAIVPNLEELLTLEFI